MAAYFIASYDVSDPDTYAKYNRGSIPVILQTMEKHGGKLLCAGDGNEWIAGERKMVILMEFPSVDAAQAWVSDEEYGAVKGLRISSTANRFEVMRPSSHLPPDQRV